MEQGNAPSISQESDRAFGGSSSNAGEDDYVLLLSLKALELPQVSIYVPEKKRGREERTSTVLNETFERMSSPNLFLNCRLSSPT